MRHARSSLRVSRAVPSLLVALLLAACANRVPTATASWPGPGAEPLQVDGVPNLFRLSDNLYRSAQPTAHGMQQLQALGIKTVVNLRTFHSDRDELAATGLGYEHIHTQAWRIEGQDAVRFLEIVTDPTKAPVLVHCQHGADRTGAMCALYRIAVQGWSKSAALAEMTDGGFGFHAIWQNLPKWIDRADVEGIAAAAGLDR